MNLRSILTLISCTAALLASGCANNNSNAGSASQPGYFSDANSYSPMPMNQAARTDAMRQMYRNEFR